ncbi:hypothetical protein BFW01_g3913 [Lasiodiplodia theobromae]|uniref:Uncharacterized protein n=2 Tax=Lasiodiplodia TaxID=66739 RepID=A0A5N5D290_9PEZI|nr:uncharacterized protein LTHEOB_8391 [Lasiodiplodia theobromae]KAB2571766.1 hypothetical protein DBV05_g9600 [Lasiodiplodia theobromae]KAF4541810.1 hypothetical protein LTHEOB_8391 [Lasiodiplodia theobromae]KAF9641791.1 hypothetical protein BFW01_g3913 [Lasiodiplodia theobromae]KAK0638250.1 hypothetical protein DIS24_g9982 [Lasiodiplodia hormozganensis]
MSFRTASRTCARQARLVFAATPRPHNSRARISTALKAAPSTRVSSRPASIVSEHARFFSSKSIADEKIEDIQELYATAKDEFEIAAEETEANTVYAADDRAAAREALDELKETYEAVVNGENREVAEEVKRRVGQRIRELDNAVVALEEAASHGD